jgi:hypothetical protein
MQLFLQVVLAYPTLPLSIVLTVCLLYWLLVAGGLLGDGLGLEAGDGLELDAGAHGLAAMLARFGLGGAPLMLVLSLLTFFAWTLVYLLQLLVLQPLPDLLRWLLGSAALLLAPLLAAFPTAAVLRPLRRLLLRLRPAAQRSLLGRVAVVSSPEVTAQQGRAMLADGGAGLVLQVRSAQGTTLLRGQAVLLVEYDRQAYCYHVVPADALEPASASRSLFESGDKESS